MQARFEHLRPVQRETDSLIQRLNRAADTAQRDKQTYSRFAALLTPSTSDRSCARTQLKRSRRVARQLQVSRMLAGSGVEPIESVGKEFDPEVHEAVETVSVEPELEGKVVAEYDRGYRMGERLLRPARVKVGRASKKVGAGE